MEGIEQVQEWLATQHVTQLEELARIIIEQIVEDYENAISIGEKYQRKHLDPWLEAKEIIS
ncbi:MAG: hypothetical protein GY730_06730 [bacterium]|nr:hypothetical protein [bacterium]